MPRGRARGGIVAGLVAALAGLVLLLAVLGGLSIWGITEAQKELLRVEQSLAQLENARAVEAAFNRYLLGELERRLRGGGDPAESREAAAVRGGLLAYRRLIGAEITTSATPEERADERAEMIRAAQLADIFEQIETRSILDRLAGEHFDAGAAARAFQDRAVDGRDRAFRAIIAEVVEDERAEAAASFLRLEDLRRDVSIAWSVFAVIFLAAAGGFALAFHRGLMRPIRVLGRAAEGVGVAPQAAITTRLPGEFQRLADRFNAMSERIGSEQRRLRDEVAARTAELEQANQRLTTIDTARRRFFTNLSHELRTPVTVLLGEAQVALRSGSGEREALERIAASGGMLRRRLEDLIRLARSDEGELTLRLGPCDLAEAIEGAVEAARAYAASNEIALEFAADGPAPVTGDADALKQAALALIDNSVKLSEPGSTVRVRVGPRAFEVADEGPGFEGVDPEQLFGRYVQEGAGRRAGGSGLGLAIVRWIAEQHGARITAVERPEGGALFRMEFPE